PDSEPLLNGPGTERGQQGLAQDTVVGGEGEWRPGAGQPVGQVQVSDVRGLAEGQRAVGRLDVGALDQADVDASRRESLQVAGRAAEVGRCRGSEPAGQALAGD